MTPYAVWGMILFLYVSGSSGYAAAKADIPPACPTAGLCCCVVNPGILDMAVIGLYARRRLRCGE